MSTDWKRNSLTGKELKKHFGLTKGDAGVVPGSTTGVKGNPFLGEGYLDEKAYKRLLKDDTFKEAYLSLGGDFTEEKWDKGISVNNMDAALDRLSAKAKKEGAKKPKKDKPYTPSPQLQQDLDRVKEWEDAQWSGASSAEVIRGERDFGEPTAKSNASDPTQGSDHEGFTKSVDFAEKYKLKLNSKRNPAPSNITNAYAAYIGVDKE